jgi:hypothetical protein
VRLRFEEADGVGNKGGGRLIQEEKEGEIEGD